MPKNETKTETQEHVTEKEPTESIDIEAVNKAVTARTRRLEKDFETRLETFNKEWGERFEALKSPQATPAEKDEALKRIEAMEAREKKALEALAQERAERRQKEEYNALEGALQEYGITMRQHLKPLAALHRQYVTTSKSGKIVYNYPAEDGPEEMSLADGIARAIGDDKKHYLPPAGAQGSGQKTSTGGAAGVSGGTKTPENARAVGVKYFENLFNGVIRDGT